MDKKQEERLLKVFSKAFHEVVPPLLKDLAKKEGVEKLAEDVALLEEGQDKIDRTLTRIEDRLDKVGQRLGGEETRIERLEKIHPRGKHTFS